MNTQSIKKWTLLLTFWLALHTSSLRAQTLPLGPYGTSPITFGVDTHGLLSATGTYGSGTLSLSGAGTRMFWYPGKAAFRAGVVGGTEWDDANIGQDSMALGTDAKASGRWSTALGSYTLASAFASTAFGMQTTASGYFSTAFGDNVAASGYASTAFGLYVGASGFASTASGYYTNASAANSFVVGVANIGGGDPTTLNPADPLFEVGNGTIIYDADNFDNVITPSDAFVVYRNGNAAIQGALTTGGTVAAHGTVRFNAGGDLSMGSFMAGTAP